MAFCTSCGATLEGSAQFCVKCGTRQAGAVPAGGGAAAAPARAQAQGGGNALKIVLIVVAGLVLLGIVGTIGSLIFLHKVAKETKIAISDAKGDSHVVTPFGTVETSKDAGDIAEKLGVEIYPGAKALPGASDVQAMGMHATTGIFQTSDSPDKVAAFYRNLYPKAMYTESNGEHNILAGSHGKGMLTINIKEEEGATRITIVNTSGKATGGPS